MNVTIYNLIRKSRVYSASCSIVFVILNLLFYYSKSPDVSTVDFIFQENKSGQLPFVMFSVTMIFCMLWFYPVSISIMAWLKKGMTNDEIFVEPMLDHHAEPTKVMPSDNAKNTINFIAVIDKAMLVLVGAGALVSSFSGDPFGFFAGVYHGAFVLPLSLIKGVAWLISLFGVTVGQISLGIQDPNTGFLYYVGIAVGGGYVCNAIPEEMKKRKRVAEAKAPSTV